MPFIYFSNDNPIKQEVASGQATATRGDPMGPSGRGGEETKVIACLGDEDTVTGLTLAGVGGSDARGRGYLVAVAGETPTSAVEETFRRFLKDPAVGVVLVSQPVAMRIRGAMDAHTSAAPAVLEVPSKEEPYDPEEDVLLRRVKHLYGGAATG